MAPPATVAAEMEEEGVLEVRCAGCGAEFACPGCATPQALPPELMPPPLRPRRALPLGAGPGAAPSRVTCGGCGAVLAVPRGLRRRLACPLCGAELAVDGGGRLAAHSGVQVVSPPGAVALAATSSRLAEEEPISRAIRVEHVQVGRYSKPIQQTGCPFPVHSIREESFSSLRSDKRTDVHVDWAKSAPVNPSVHREESCIKLFNVTVDRRDFMKKSRPSAGPGSVCVDKVRVEHPSKVSHVPRAQGPFNHSVHAEEAHGENQSGTLGRTGIQRARHADISSIVEQETAEPPSQIDCAEQVEVESRGNTTRWNQKRTTRVTAGNIQDKNMGSSSSNEEIQITCSKHKQPEGIRHHIQQPTSSSNENRFHPADVDVIIARLCPSSLPQKQVSQARSNDLDRTDATLPPASINHGTSQGGCFPPGYRQYQAVATGSLADQGLSSAHEHEVSEESSNGIDPHNRSSTQVRLNPSFGVLHRQHIQHYPSHDSQSEQAQVESHSNKIVGHCRNTAKDSMYLSNEGDYIGQPCTGKDQQVTLGQQ